MPITNEQNAELLQMGQKHPIIALKQFHVRSSFKYISLNVKQYRLVNIYSIVWISSYSMLNALWARLNATVGVSMFIFLIGLCMGTLNEHRLQNHMGNRPTSVRLLSDQLVNFLTTSESCRWRQLKAYKQCLLYQFDSLKCNCSFHVYMCPHDKQYFPRIFNWSSHVVSSNIVVHLYRLLYIYRPTFILNSEQVQNFCYLWPTGFTEPSS